MAFELYGCSWRVYAHPLEVELHAIANDGYWMVDGQKFGKGLFHHFMQVRQWLWPNRYRHKWTDLLYQNFIDNEITIMMGSASSQKTSHAAEYVLINYLARPHNTLVILTTYNVDKLESGIFGEVKMLFREAKANFDFLPGFVLDHKHAITTDNLEEKEVRDMRKGIVGKPCYVGRQYVGLGVFAGIKQQNIFFLSDELQTTDGAFLKAWPNMFSNGRLKIIGSGNAWHNPDDALGIAAEPKNGWNSIPEPDVTTVWETRFMNAKCVNLVGTDSPNFSVKNGEKEPYPGLIGWKLYNRIVHDYGETSPEFYTQVKGVMKLSLAHSRVITRDICRQHHASDKVVWKGGGLTRVLGVDPAYGGGDRCTSLALEFGPGLPQESGVIGEVPKEPILIRVLAYRTIPINAKRTDISPEDQIANGVEEDLRKWGIPNENCFYDAFGKGTVGFAFARKFGSNSPIPVDSGGRPSSRPVRMDLYVWDEGKRQKRHKRCDEEYSKFVTEMWFSVRQCIESEQLRELPDEIMLEGCMREYKIVNGNRKEVEPKDELRERLGKSPDLFDVLAVALEGARQRGFAIERLGDKVDEEDGEALQWLAERSKKNRELLASKQLARR